MEEDTLKSHFENIIKIGQKQYYRRNQVCIRYCEKSHDALTLGFPYNAIHFNHFPIFINFLVIMFDRYTLARIHPVV